MGLSYKFERSDRVLSERRQRDRNSDRTSPTTRLALDMRPGLVKRWGGAFQVGPSRGPEANRGACTNRLQIRTKRTSPDTIQALERRVGHSRRLRRRGVGWGARGIASRHARCTTRSPRAWGEREVRR